MLLPLWALDPRWDNWRAKLPLSRGLGDKYKLSYFNPLTLAVEDLSLNVERKEKITVGGKDFDTFVVQADSPMGGMTTWQEEADGDAVKIKSIMGIDMIRQSKKEAMSGIKGGSPGRFRGAYNRETQPEHPIAARVQDSRRYLERRH